MLTRTRMSRGSKVYSSTATCLAFIGGVLVLLGGDMVLFGVGAIMFAMELPVSLLGDWFHERRFKLAVGLRAIGFFAQFAGAAFVMAQVYTIMPVAFWVLIAVVPLVVLVLYVVGRLARTE